MILTVVLGRLTRDPVVRATKSGKTFCSFTVAADYRAKDKDGNKLTGFFDCTAWEQLGELCGKYLSKGRQVLVTGEVGIDTYTTQAGENRAKLTLKADKVEFIMDSELVIKQMRGEYKVKSPNIMNLHRDAKSLSSLIPEVKFTHVKRENQFVSRADALLNAEMDRH